MRTIDTIVVFVLDSTALDLIPDACGGIGQCGPCLNALEQMIVRQEVCFCRETVKALQLLSPDGVHYSWARAAVASMWSPGVNWKQTQEVVYALEDHMEMDLLDDDPELVFVLAVAKALADDSDDVTIVTADDLDKVDCLGMVSAAALVGVPTVDLTTFGNHSGLNVHFV